MLLYLLAVFWTFFYRATLCVSVVFAVVRCPSVSPVDRIQTAEDIIKLLSRPGSLTNLVFDPERRYPIPSAEAQNTRGGKILRFLTEIAVYVGNSMRKAHGYYGTLIGSHR